MTIASDIKRRPSARPHFLAYGAAHARDTRAPYAVLPVPYERTVSFGRGTGRAPAAILRASAEIELFDEELRQPLDFAVQTLPPVACRHGSDRQILAAIGRSAAKVLNAGRFLLTLGGEHTISAPLVQAAAAVHAGLSVLQCDAHLDLRASFRGTGLSHACVMHRVLEMGVPAVAAGIRSVCAEEHELITRRQLPVFWGREIAAAKSLKWQSEVIRQLGPVVYITVDVDCLDTGVMPGTGTPEPGGLSWYALTGLLRRVCSERRVVAVDIVETVPQPGSPVSEYAAARLAAKLLLYHRIASGT